MTPSELKYHIESSGHESYFFTRKTMSFFGDTIKNYGVRSEIIRCYYDSEGVYIGTEGVDVEVWELYRKRPVKHGLKESAYFDKTTFKRVHPIK